MTRLLPISFDYTDRDFASLKLRLQGLVQSVFPTWTDFSEGNFGNILLELMAYVGDILGFYQDNQADEAFLPTLAQRTSLIKVGQLIDFRLRGASAATTTERIYLPVAPPSLSMTVPAGTRLRSMDPEEPVTFQVTATTTLNPGGNAYVDVPIEQSEDRFETFNSTDEPNQLLILEGTPFLDTSLDTVVYDGVQLVYGISAANGDYTKVDSFLGYTSADKVFTLLVDHLDRGIVRFGNGTIGAIPQGQINVGYKIGGGTQGNVEAFRITVIEDQLFLEDGSPAAGVSCTNLSAATGGADRETVDEGRARAPSTLRALTRSVTRNDFEEAAKSVRGVARAIMVTANEYSGMEENTGVLYVVQQGAKYTSGRIGPADASSSLLASVKSWIDTNRPPTITFYWTTATAVWKQVPVAIRIALARGYSTTTVAAAIRAALYDFFAPQLSNGLDNSEVDFGANLQDVDGTIVGELAWSDVFNVVRDIAGVRKVDEGSQGFLLDGHRQSIILTPVQFPKLTAVTITDMETGSAL